MKKMMNRSEASFVPSTLMSFAGLETDTFLIPNAPFLDNPSLPPPLVPMGGFPLYLPPAEPEYPTWLAKSEEGASGYGGIGLNLGHRTYLSLDGRFEGCSSLGLPHPPLCQAEGCRADLWRVKHYHRRHKVCEFHSKATVVMVAGLRQRFCQQCSRFHLLAEFDEAKRSCRRRLAEHNRRRRRRKPQPQPQPQPPPTATSEYLSISSSKNTGANTSEKAKQAQEPSRYRNYGAESLSGAAAADKGSTSNAMSRAEGAAAIDDIVAVAADEEKEWPASAFNSAYLERHSSSNWSITHKLFFSGL